MLDHVREDDWTYAGRQRRLVNSAVTVAGADYVTVVLTNCANGVPVSCDKVNRPGSFRGINRWLIVERKVKRWRKACPRYATGTPG